MPFYIQNIDTGLVLDIKNGNKEACGEIIMYHNHGGKNQLWKYKNGMIYSKHNKLVLDIDQQNGQRIITHPAHGGANQLWYFDGDNTIRSGTGLVLDVKDNNRGENASVIVWSKNGGSNQRFRKVEV